MSFNPNSPYTTLTDVDGTIYVLQGGIVYDKFSNSWTAVPRSKSGAVAVAGNETYLSTNIPVATPYPAGQTIIVTDVGLAPTRLVSDGQGAWRPLNGRALLYQRSGTLAAPLATLTGVTAGLFTLPQTLLIPAGLVPPQGKVTVEAEFQRIGATATGVVRAFLGNTNSSSDTILPGVSMGTTTLLIMPKYSGSLLWGASTTAATIIGAVGENATSSSGALADSSTNNDRSQPMYVNIGIASANAADQFNLVNYRVWLEG